MSNVETMEHELSKLDGRNVCIVRPFFGTQSDSWTGRLTVLIHRYPLEFHFGFGAGAILFTAEDVVEIDNQDDDDNPIVIRLKGPLGYSPQPALAVR